MDRTKVVGCVIAALVMGACSHGGSSRPIVVGAKNFTEQLVLGEIIAQHLEHKLGVKVQREFNLGGTLLAHQALAGGEIDMYPEYTGTAMAAILKDTSVLKDSDAALAHVQAEYKKRFQVAWLAPLGIDNGFAMVIRGEDARGKDVASLGAAARAGEWKLGEGYEFEQRADGLGALREMYGFRTAGAPKTMDLGLLYQALEQKQVDMIAANATDGMLSKMDVKALSDDLHAFPPYQVSVAVRQDRLNEVPGLEAALGDLAGKFTNEKMQRMNYLVDGEHKPAADVARDFLKAAGL